MVAKRAIRIFGFERRIYRHLRAHPAVLDCTLLLECARLVPQRLDARRPVGISEVEMREVAAIVDDADDDAVAQSSPGGSLVGAARISGTVARRNGPVCCAP